MSDELINLIVKRMVARSDVKARQFSNGYVPVRTDEPNPQNIPWTRQDFQDHLDGRQSYGHYLVNKDDQCKIFAFDIDLDQSGVLPSSADPLDGVEGYIAEPNLRDAWHVKAAPPGHPLHSPLLWARREYMKIQFMLLAKTLAMTIVDLMELDVAVAYSGNKGVHVYGFLPNPMDAYSARFSALTVLEACELTPFKGSNFFKSTDLNPLTGFPNLSVEVYPKQESIGDKDLGNLLRLPLGRNLKNPGDPTFFIDMTEDLNIMKPTDPLRALTPGNNFLARA